MATTRLSLETVSALPDIKRISRPYPGTVDLPTTYVEFEFKGGKEGFGVTIWYTPDGAIETVYITDNDDDGNWYRSSFSFKNMRTFEELKEVCRLLDIIYPENWP